MDPDLTEPGDLQHVTLRTLRHYEARAEAFRAGTRDHDVRQNIEALLSHVEHPAPLTILDLGCGPGRDLRTLSEMGHVAIGLDGAATFVAMARAYSGCEVWLQNFLQLDLPAQRFDGIFANAALFHVPTDALPRVLGELRTSLRPRGVLFASNPHGHDEEGWNRERYSVYHDVDSWRAFMTGAGFVEIEHYYRPPGLPRERQPWLATVWRKP